jgi:Citrate lyase, alpha subunit
MTFRRAAKVDSNQPEIVDAFRRMGCSVLIISQLKKCADLMVAKNDTTAAIEVKDGTLPKSKRQLTEGEMDFMHSWKGLYFIVESLDDVLRVVKELES